MYSDEYEMIESQTDKKYIHEQTQTYEFGLEDEADREINKKNHCIRFLSISVAVASIYMFLVYLVLIIYVHW